jgi:hypothetical protein
VRCLFAALVGAATLLAACASGVDGARQALANADVFLSGATQTFEKFDAAYQKSVVDTAPDKATAERDLAAYRARRSVVVKVIRDAGAVLALGPPLIMAVELGQAKSKDLGAWLSTLWDAVGKVTSALTTFGVKVPVLGGP